MEKKVYKTEQEAFWAGEFGDEYLKRNDGVLAVASNLAFFGQALKRCTSRIQSMIEFGANIGLNQKALQLLLPEASQHAIEINPKAAARLGEVIPPPHIFQTSILDFTPPRTWDLVLIKGVLIHINPEFLPQVYKALYESTARYLLLGEYYNPTPVEVEYRGHNSRLFKRDFCGEMLDFYPDLKLVDYGFVYRRDTQFPDDDMNWFLVEKRA